MKLNSKHELVFNPGVGWCVIAFLLPVWIAGCSKSANPGGQGGGGVGGMLAGASGSGTSQAGAGGSSGATATGQSHGGSGGMTTFGSAGHAASSGGAGGSAGSAGQSATAGAGGAAATGGTGVGGAAGMAAGGTGGAGGCTRDKLKAAVDAFYMALAAHNTDGLSLAATVKYTENAKMMMPGEGVWKTAGMVKFKRTAVDTMTCQTATESVIPNTGGDFVYGVRLKLDDAGKISEIETIYVTPGSYLTIDPQGLLNSKDDDWETVLPPDKQMPRDKLQSLMDVYQEQFPTGGCGFDPTCQRLEDGQLIAGFTCSDGLVVSCNPNGGGGSPAMKVRQHVIDVDAGISVGFVIFAGADDDFHLFKVRDGLVKSVHAVLTNTNGMSGWD